MTGTQDAARCRALRRGLFMSARDWERRAQGICFATGQVLCMRAEVATALDEWALRRVAAEQWEALHP